LPFGALLWSFGLLLGFWLFAVGDFLPLSIGKKLLLWALLVWEAFGREKNY
jgi:hypothetical protein